jgi:hypothetical protein
MKKTKHKKHKLLLRNLTLDEYDNLAVLMEHVYDNLGGAWKKDQYISQITRFAQGQIVIEDNGVLVAAALNFFVALEKNDYVEIIWRTDNTAISLETLPTSTSPTRPTNGNSGLINKFNYIK